MLSLRSQCVTHLELVPGGDTVIKLPLVPVPQFFYSHNSDETGVLGSHVNLGDACSEGKQSLPPPIFLLGY